MDFDVLLNPTECGRIRQTSIDSRNVSSTSIAERDNAKDFIAIRIGFDEERPSRIALKDWNQTHVLLIKCSQESTWHASVLCWNPHIIEIGLKSTNRLTSLVHNGVVITRILVSFKKVAIGASLRSCGSYSLPLHRTHIDQHWRRSTQIIFLTILQRFQIAQCNQHSGLANKLASLFDWIGFFS